MKDKILEVSLTEIVMSKWDVRRYPEDKEELEALAESIAKDGLINPITVTPTEGGKYQVIAGRRRYRACKHLGLKTIPVYVKFDTNFDETDLRRITLIENIHRKGLVNMEKAHGVKAVYESAGYPVDDAIHGVKSIDNWFANHENANWSQLQTEQYSVSSDKPVNPLRQDSEFVEICKSIGLAPKYQYQLMQLCQLEPDVQEAISEMGLRTDYAILLTNRTLKGYHYLRIALAEHIKQMKLSHARAYIQQFCHDMETGYLQIKPEDKEFPVADLNKKERLQRGNRAAKEMLDYYLDIMVNSKKLMYSLSGRAISKGETMYNRDMIDNKDAHNHRLQIVKSLNSDVRQLNLLYNEHLKLSKLAIEDMMHIIEQEMQTIEKKRGMMGK